MLNNQGQDQSILYPLIAIIAGLLGNVANFLANAEALYSTIGFLASTLLIGVGVIGIFVQQNRVKLKDGILYAVIWTLFIGFTGAGYYILISQPATVYGRVLDNVNQRNPVSGVEVSLYHYDTGTTRQVLTGSNGDFRFGDVDDGEYDLIINGINIHSGDSPSGWDKLFAGDINAGRFYLENIAGGQNPPVLPTVTPDSLTPTNTDTFIPSTNTPIPPTATNTIIPTPVFTSTSTLTRTPRSTNTPRPPTSTPTFTPSPTDIPESAILYEEDFEDGRADHVLHESWSENRFSIIDDGTGNFVWSGTGSIYAYLANASDWSNYAISLEFLSKGDIGDSSTEAFEVRFRRVNSDDNYTIYISSYWHRMLVDINWDTLPIAEGEKGSVGLYLAPNVWHRLYIEADGSIIRWQFDDGEIFDGFDETYSSGGFAISLNELAGEIWIDNIRIWSLDESD